MKKRIYQGIPKGFFFEEIFEAYLKDLGDKVFWEGYLNLEEPYNCKRIYHLIPQGIAIKYESWRAKWPIGILKKGVRITLYGTEESISEVEKMILQKAKEFKKKELSQRIEKLQNNLQNEEK